MHRILVVDDEPNLLAAIVGLLAARGFAASGCATGEEAIAIQPKLRPDAVVLDIMLPGLSGHETFTRLRELDPSLAGVFITAHGSVPSAVAAIRSGGYDYLIKPFDNDHLVLTVERSLERRGLVARVRELEHDLSARSEFSAIVGRAPAIVDAIRKLARVSGTDATVLLTGESGTGKELAAKSLHRASSRANKPFVAINCGAIASSLAETELFGHERGAFTDAKTEHPGRFEQADQGTLFLDEIGELVPDLQVKILRVLEEGEVHRVGGHRSLRVSVRVIAATNRDLAREVTAGRFREDLFWRLNVIQVEMPSLRQRREDLPLLIDVLLDRVNAECRTAVTGLSNEVMDRLNAHAWPGNVRELLNVLRHAVVMADESTIQLSDLPDYVVRHRPETLPGSSTNQNLEHALATTERQLIAAMLERFRGNRTAAAEALGIDRRTLHKKLLRYRREDSDLNR